MGGTDSCKVTATLSAKPLTNSQAFDRLCQFLERNEDVSGEELSLVAQSLASTRKEEERANVIQRRNIKEPEDEVEMLTPSGTGNTVNLHFEHQMEQEGSNSKLPVVKQESVAVVKQESVAVAVVKQESVAVVKQENADHETESTQKSDRSDKKEKKAAKKARKEVKKERKEAKKKRKRDDQ
jgi:hypothetical protein